MELKRVGIYRDFDDQAIEIRFDRDKDEYLPSRGKTCSGEGINPRLTYGPGRK